MLEMHREFSGDLGCSLPVRRFEAHRYQSMEHRASSAWLTRKQYFAIERMKEVEPRRNSAIRPRHRLRFTNKRVSPRQRSKRGFDMLDRHVGGSRDRRTGECGANDAGNFEQTTLELVQSIELPVDGSANIDRYSERSSIDMLLNHPPPDVTNEDAPGEQIVEHVDEKQRIAVGVLICNARQLFQ
jgi:hypothetical protein